MLEKIKNYILEQKMISKEDCVIIGVSGGADSICLLFVMLEMQKSIGNDLVVVHVNHGLRGEDADQDEMFVKTLCEEKNVKYECYRENVEFLAKKWKQSTEEAGRNFRKECFEKAAKLYGGTKIALAHHKNDSAETFIMNLARGTGLKGLGGISPIQGKVIRPLLCVERKEIEAFLETEQIAFCTDMTNASDDYTRNRIRNHIIPFMENELNVKTVEHMDETMAYLRKVQQFLELQADKCWENCVKEKEEGYVLLKEMFLEIPDAIKPIVIKQMLSKVSGRQKDLESAHVQGVICLLEKQVGRKMNLPYNMEARRIYEGLWIGQKKTETDFKKEEILFVPGKETYTWGNYQIICRIVEKSNLENSRENSGTKWFDYDIISDGISFRGRKSGDYITIHKDGSTQKLKAYFINEKIPQEERDDILLIASGSHVLCIWGYRENSAYKVNENTKCVLEICAQKI